MNPIATALSKTSMPKEHPRALKRHLLLLVAVCAAVPVVFAQGSAQTRPTENYGPANAFPFTHPLQEVPDTFHMNGFRYITLRHGQPWKQPVNDGKTIYLMQMVPRPARRHAAAKEEEPSPLPREQKKP